MSRRKQRRIYLTTLWFRIHGGDGYERPTVPKLPRIQLPPPPTAGLRPVRLGIAGLYAIAGQPDALAVLVGLKPAPTTNSVHREPTFTWDGNHFVEDDTDATATEAATQESFRRRSDPKDSYYRVAKRSWKRYRRAQYRPRLVSGIHQRLAA